jgi:hypothetical protein
MTKLSVNITENGVRGITARCRSVAEANVAGQISARIALPLSLVHSVIVGESFSENAGEVDPQIFVARGDGEFDQLPLCVASPIFSLRDTGLVPQWFIDAARRIFRGPQWNECSPSKLAELAVEMLERAGLPWFQNGGWSDSAILVSEPDFISANDILGIMEFCTTGNLLFRIVGTSNTRPSETLRLEIFPVTARAT